MTEDWVFQEDFRGKVAPKMNPEGKVGVSSWGRGDKAVPYSESLLVCVGVRTYAIVRDCKIGFSCHEVRSCATI